MQLCDFEQIIQVAGVATLRPFLEATGVHLEIRDFRTVVSRRNSLGVLNREEIGPTDPAGCIRVDLGQNSALCPLDVGSNRYRVTCYDPRSMTGHHSDGRHEYFVSRSVLSSDVIINVGKMKTHKKAGVTGALKNSVGINTNNEYLPHHRSGSPAEGGDEYRKASVFKAATSRFLDRENMTGSWAMKYLYHLASMGCWGMAKLVKQDRTWEGSWPGNDTLWRTVLDLNRILLYADKNGVLRDEPQRKMLCVVDGIISGEGEGPLAPTPRRTGVIIVGTSPARVDAVMATVMGFDWQRIPVIREAMRRVLGSLNHGPYNVADVVSNRPELCGPLGRAHWLHSFVPPRGWGGNIELREEQ
jgi:hypothetical protein